MKKILIIGSDSFIAGKFIKSFESNYNIKLYSRKKTNLDNEIVLDDFFQISKSDFIAVNIVINFAAIVHQPYLKDESLYIKVNTDLPLHLAKEAKEAGVNHFIQMSTIAVYGNVSSINEQTIEKPDNIYGQTKLDADKTLLAMQDKNFSVSIVRPPMVYGGGNAPGNMMKLIRFAQKGFPMPFKGIDNKRTFINVYNLIVAISCIIENKLSDVQIPTDKSSISTSEILKIVNKYSHTKIRQIAIPNFAHSIIKVVVPSIYEKVFGNLKVQCNLSEDIYKPKYAIEDGIKEMIDSIE